MLKRLRKIKISTLISNAVVTLAYPFVKSFISKSNKLLIFTDSLTIISLLLIVLGVVYTFYQKGDFDHISYAAKRNQTLKTREAYYADRKEEREESFNYPLFLGILYFVFGLSASYMFL